MSAGTATNRVIPLNGVNRSRSPGYRLLADCRDQLVSRLYSWLREIAAPVSEELFVLADATRERLLQTRYLDLRADIEKDWPHLVETFRRELSAEAERCLFQEERKPETSASPLEIPDFEGLQLVDDQDLSEHIVIREFSAQLAETCDEELYTLNRRVAALLGHDEEGDCPNPLAPAIVCSALSDACATLGSSAEERLLLLRRLERHLHQALPPIYREINAFLIERGILPELKRTYRRTVAQVSASDTPVSATASATSATPTGGSANAPAAATPALSGQGILDALQRLAQTRMPVVQSGLSQASLPLPGATTPADQSADGTIPLDAASINRLLLSSLNELQHQHVPVTDPGGVIVNQVRLVRDSEGGRQVGGLEAVTIDIVAMLFDFILDDVHIPVAVKALLSRLQIPVLKVAMMNPGFFADRQHPTRRFLGGVSGVSIRWGNTVDESDPFYGKLSELVERIQAEFENDVEVFGTALTELETFVDEREHEEESTAMTAAELVTAREKESSAWERAQREVESFRRMATPHPPLIESFITEHWTRVLQASALKDDNDASWKTGCDTMRSLVWSVEPKKAPNDRLKLITLLPTLLAEINKGLDTIKAGSAERAAFFDALVKFHSAALKGEAPPAPPPAPEKAAPPPVAKPAIEPPSDGDLLITRSVDHGVAVEEVILVGASPIWRADDREIFRQVSELKRGDWIEFIDEDGQHNRERLNWISPQRGILLFSNHRSAKAISVTPDALARQIRDGKAAILREEAIFERALNGALESVNAT